MGLKRGFYGGKGKGELHKVGNLSVGENGVFQREIELFLKQEIGIFVGRRGKK